MRHQGYIPWDDDADVAFLRPEYEKFRKACRTELDNYLLRSIHNFECFCLRKVLWARVGKVADKNPLMRIWYRLLDKIPEQKIFAYYHKLIRRSNRIGGRMVRILMFPTPNSEYGYYRCWYETSSLIEFEGVMFEGIRDYDCYLSFKF